MNNKQFHSIIHMIEKLKILIILISFHITYFTPKKTNFYLTDIQELLKSSNNSRVDGNKLFNENNIDKLNLLKARILNIFSRSIGKKIDYIKYIYLGGRLRFGNQLIRIYNTMFICEILGCKKIFLEKENNWYLKNKIFNKKYKIFIEPIFKKSLNKLNIIIEETYILFYFSYILLPIKRVNVLRKEIMRNLPILKVNYNDLFIYIRSGDIFMGSNPHCGYIQPPFCFYRNVLDNYKYKITYIISENKNNPVIGKILDNYPNIIYNINSLKIDICYLVNAYNLVGGGISSFFYQIILLNNNIKNFWEYIFKKPSKSDINVTFHSFKRRDIRKYIMYSNNNYYEKMKPWTNNQSQRDLMINDDCSNSFIVI